MIYVAVDIGCIECGEGSNVLGLFTDKVKAQAVLDAAEKEQAANWHGEHHFGLFEQDTIQE